jgi:hypothetical protein
MSIVIPAPPQGGYTLTDYEFLTRRLLHDATGRQYDTESIDRWINLARDRVARDSCSVRYLQTGVQLLQGQEVYPQYITLPFGPVTVDVLGVTVYWGNLRVKLNYLAWNNFDARLRSQQLYTGIPAAWSRYGGNVYIGPVPNQAYVSDWDTALTPNLLTSPSDPEQIPIPFQNPVPFYAAYYAKMYEQSFGESNMFLDQYKQQMINANATWARRQISQNYSS